MIGDRWGVTDADVARAYPCDAIVAAPVVQAWRGVTVQAMPADVWRWLIQVQLAPYSYDWIDNLGRRSPRELRAVPDPEPGRAFTRSCGRPLGEVLSVVPEQHLTARIAGAIMSYVLVPSGAQTRLLLKIVLARGRLLGPFVSVGDLVMARRQLLNFKQLAEASVPVTR